MRLLLIEDHRAMREIVADFLRARGFAIDCVRLGRDAANALETVEYDAIILDLGLPDMDGLDVLKRVRAERNGEPPALILTARDSVADRVLGLDAGADDYMLKPFALTELEARLRAILRRPGTRRTLIYRFHDLELAVASRTARSDGADLDLTRRELSVLEELLAASGRVVVKDALEDKLYGFDEPVTVNALEAAISRLRRKLAAAGCSVKVEVVRGIGYRLRGGSH